MVPMGQTLGTSVGPSCVPGGNAVIQSRVGLHVANPPGAWRARQRAKGASLSASPVPLEHLPPNTFVGAKGKACTGF